MKLTALEIKQQQFEKALRGYDISEVNAYLNLIANEWEHLAGKVRELETKLETADNKLKHYEKVEQALHETLKTAKENAEQKLESTNKEAGHIIEKAEIEAENIIKDATQRRQQIRQSILRLIERREEIISGMNSYLDMAQQSLQNLTRDDTFQYSLPNEEDESKSDHNKASTGSDKARSQKQDYESAPSGSDDLDDILDNID
jgi:cell division initiation protein